MNVALRGLQKIFHFVTQIRNYFFNHGLFRIREVKVPVVSVGNITFGGTGKTPTVIKIADEIRNNGFKVVIISRGYKRWSFFSRIVSDTEKIRMSLRRAGDEPYLLANKLKGIPVIVSKKRFKGALKAIKKFNPDIILLDDGFQHRKLKRTLDVVLIDSPEILANNTLMR
ncbi:tetraacyldisaccharide 4'-kinase [candidate division KSB1 bacterium]|nr:tetraacyldisaccharide 4'-kinase [candidate division KSB1 bacterium]